MMQSAFKIPPKGCRPKREDGKPFDSGCPFFSLDVAGGNWSCACALSGVLSTSEGLKLYIQPNYDHYHERRPEECPFDKFPHRVTLQAVPGV